MNNLRTKEFITKAKVIHGDKYDYSEVKYTGCYNKVKIYCKTHNSYYWKSPNNHTHGTKPQGCPKCGHERSGRANGSNIVDFIKKSKSIHGDKFNYDRTIHRGTKAKVILTCTVHEVDFDTTPDNHYMTKYGGCNRCLEDAKSLDNYYHRVRRLSKEEFIRRAKELHGDLYGYEQIVLIDSNSNLKIWCTKHSEWFWHRARYHLTNKGCMKCKSEHMSKVKSMTTEEFITKAVKVHRKRYDYSKVEVISGTEKVDIYCKVHKRVFQQEPNNHLRGQGCPTCSESKGERMVRHVLSDLGIKYIHEYSIPGSKQLSYDFYLPDHNVYIEYHGIQHYEYVEFFHRDMVKFDRGQFIDRFKKRLVRSNGGRFISIKYTNDTKLKIETVLRRRLGALGIKI